MEISRESIYILILLLSICGKIWSQKECSFTNYIHPGTRYLLNNPNFPYGYPAGRVCTWFMSTMKGYNVKLACRRVEMPSFGPTCLDILSVTTTGDMKDAIKHCTPFTAEGPTINMQFYSEQWSGGGIFSCGITAEKIPTNANIDGGNCSCGWSFRTRIVGGTEAGINEFPSMVLFYSYSKQSQWCGGTIIGRTTVLTAGHCFETDRNPNNYGLIVGEHDLRTRKETNATKLLAISRIIVHDNFLPNDGGNDLALVVTVDYIVFTSRVGPACLPFNIQKDDIMLQYITVTGWGTKQFAGPLAKVLQKTRLQIVEDSQCETVYKKNFNSMRHLCTYYPGKDACQFDSGGPLYYFNYLTNTYAVVGTVSFGIDCAFKDPAVNVNVNHFLPWIQKMLPDEQFCRG